MRGTVGLAGWIDDVATDVIFHHFSRQAIHRTMHCGDQHQHVGAPLAFEATLEGLDLTPDPPNPSP